MSLLLTVNQLSQEQLEILYHTKNRTAGGFYCGGGSAMDALVDSGLMELAGRKSFVPDMYYRITPEGILALQDAKLRERAIREASERARAFACGDCDPCLGGRPDQCAVMSPGRKEGEG